MHGSRVATSPGIDADLVCSAIGAVGPRSVGREGEAADQHVAAEAERLRRLDTAGQDQSRWYCVSGVVSSG
jgi:hypothetical protein